MFNKSNFYKESYGMFKQLNLKVVSFDANKKICKLLSEIFNEKFEHNYRSYSRTGFGSNYFVSENILVRISDHWGLGIRSCNWYLENQKEIFVSGKKTVAFIRFDDLKQVKNFE